MATRFIVGQKYIPIESAADVLSGTVLYEKDDGTLYTELQQNNIFTELKINNIKHIAIQGEPGLRFSFGDIIGPLVGQEITTDNEETIENIIETKGITLSSFGLYELDISKFNLSINSLYIYWPKDKNKLSQDIIIDYMYETQEGGIVNG